MKTLLVLASLGLLASCGMTEGLQKNCGSDIKEGCNFLFGMRADDQQKAIDDINKKNEEQDARLNVLEEQNQNLIASINSLGENLADNIEETATNSSMIATLQNTVNANVIQLLSLSNNITVLNGNVSGLQGQITALDSSLSKTIVGMIDPCGDGSGFDEIILKTKDGKYIGYFEDGSKRFLSILSAGDYRTTDFQSCHFTVTTDGRLVF